jgi:hypothetical protein
VQRILAGGIGQRRRPEEKKMELIDELTSLQLEATS